MRPLGLVVCVLTLSLCSGASADHKASHPKPPSHARMLSAPLAIMTPAAGQMDATGWRTYVDELNRFKVDLPLGLFDPVMKYARGISLRAPLYGAVIDVYSSTDANGFDPKQFVAEIENADRVRAVTYRAAGKHWFVLSGFYSKTEAGDAVIFYTKFMFSADRSRLTAFEISFPASAKPRFANVVERIEDTFTPLRR